MLFDDLFAESTRQLNICNSCRYCAGYCPVWPALELRTELQQSDITHLANLCHDCQDCLTACMYSPPHEFAVNPPRMFAEVREATYRNYVWPAQRVDALSGRRGLIAGLLASSMLVMALALLTGKSAVITGSHSRSPYELIPHLALVIVVLAPAVFTAIVMTRAAALYWRDIGGTVRALLDVKAWTKSLHQVATLRHQTGGDEGCSYPDGEPSGARRRFHHLVAYGFLLTLVSTATAWFMETFLRDAPPFPLLSAPVITGTVGGLAASIGCIGLLALKRRADRLQTSDSMRRADTALLWALLALMGSGLLVLVTRTTPAFAVVLSIHLAAIILAFAIAPYTKFFHWVYRVLSVHYDNVEAGARTGS